MRGALLLIFLLIMPGWPLIIDSSGYEIVKDIVSKEEGVFMAGHITYSKLVNGIVVKVKGDKLEWYKQFDIGVDEFLTSLCPTPDGVIAAGYVKLNDGVGVIILAINDDGSLLWSRVYKLDVPDLKIFSCNMAKDSIVLAGGVLNRGMDALVIYLNKQGEIINATTFGTELDEWVNSATFYRGHLILAGGVYFNSSDVWIANLSSGEISIFSGPDWQEAYSISSSRRNILVVGSTRDESWDVLAIMLEGRTPIWEKRYGTVYMDMGYDGKVGNISYIAGESRCYGGGCNALLMKIDRLGNILESFEFGGDGMERAFAIDYKNDQIVLAGYSDSFSWDPWGGILVVSGENNCLKRDVKLQSKEVELKLKKLIGKRDLVIYHNVRVDLKVSDVDAKIKNPCGMDLEELIGNVIPIIGIVVLFITIYVSWRFIFKSKKRRVET